MPEGKLRISNNRGIPRYYHIKEAKDTRGKYIIKEKQKLAQLLAQKEYLNRIEKELLAELKDINNYLKKHGASELEDKFAELNVYRKELVDPLVLPDELYVQQWENEKYETNTYLEEQKVYATKKGELVRTKSEVLLADMYMELGIPYRYEAAVSLRDGRKKYPDFTLLNPLTRQLIYHEHLGLLDDNKYRKSNLKKLNEYRRNSIYPGKNLIVTHEAEGSYLNINEIREMVCEMFGISDVTSLMKKLPL